MGKENRESREQREAMSVGAWKQSRGGVLEEDGRWSDIAGWDPGEPVQIKNPWL